MKETIQVTDEQFVRMITESVMRVLKEAGGGMAALGNFMKGLNVGELASGAKNAFADATGYKREKSSDYFDKDDNERRSVNGRMERYIKDERLNDEQAKKLRNYMSGKQ